MPGKIKQPEQTFLPRWDAPGVGLSLQSPGSKEAQFSLAGVPPVEHDCATTPRQQASEAIHLALSHVL